MYSVFQEYPDSHSSMRVRILLGHTVLDFLGLYTRKKLLFLQQEIIDFLWND